MKKLIGVFWILEFVSALLIVSGIVTADFAYIFLFFLAFGIWKLSDLEALELYILSIPIFVALPSSSLSDSMSVWRIALLVFILKIFLKRFDIWAIISKKDLDLAGRKQKLFDGFKIFIGEIRSSNYYGIALPVALFGIVSLFSLLFAQSVGAGIKKLIFLGSIFLLFGIVRFAVRSKDDAMRIMKSIFVSAVFILLVGYGQFAATFFVNLSDFWGIWDNYVINAFYGQKMMTLLSYSNTWFSYYDPKGEIPPTLRMFSVMPDSHSFSMLMILFAPLALFYFYSCIKKSDKAKYVLIFALMILAIFFSGSRGAWVGWLGAVIASLYFYFREKLPEKLRIFKAENIAEHRKIYKMVLISVMSFIVLFPVSNFVLSSNQDSQLIREGKMAGQERFALLKRTWSISDMDETSNKGRMEIWRDSAISIMKHPITGIGMGNFPLALSEKISTSKMGASAHNIYLDVAVETGIFGVMIFLYLLRKICEKLFHLSQKFKEEKFRLLALSFLVYFIWICAYGFFDVVILNDKVLMFIVLILAVLYKVEDLEITNNL